MHGRTVERPGPGELHVWSLRFADLAPQLDRLERGLDDAERERASRFATEELRQRWALGRGAARHILAGCLGIAAGDVPIVARPCTACGARHGKPALAPPADDLRFNVSHTRERLLIAVAERREVGIDAEPADRAPTLVSTAHTWLAEPELQAVERLTPAAKDRALLRLWTAKEAYLKAVGVGLNADLREVEIGLDEEPELRAAPGETQPGRWQLSTIAAAEDTVAVVAVAREGGERREVTIRTAL
jgi:4'-phosphopantetheinyl transferase